MEPLHNLIYQKNSLSFQKKPQSLQEVVGYLNPISWDLNGRPKQFAIYDKNEEDVIIEGYPYGYKLKSLLNKRVKALGHVRRDREAIMYIRPSSIKLLETQSANSSIHFIHNEWFEELPICIPQEKVASKAWELINTRDVF